MKDLTAAYGELLQDKRIRAEQSKYEAVSRQRNAVLSKFKKTYQAFLDVWAGLEKARQFYDEMVETVDSLEKNVETFVSNRKSEGAQLLSQIEMDIGNDAERQQRKLRDMMERVSLGSGSGTPNPEALPPKRPIASASSNHAKSPSSAGGHAQSPPGTPRYPQYGNYSTTAPPQLPQPPASAGYPGYTQYPTPNQNGYGRRESYGQIPQVPRRESYQNQTIQRRESHQAIPTTSPPSSTQPQPSYLPGHYSSPPNLYSGQVPGYGQPQPYNPGSYMPPPPPPGPPPGGLANRQSYGVLPQTTYQPPPPPPHPPGAPMPSEGYSYGQQPQQAQQGQQGADPWAGLTGWK